MDKDVLILAIESSCDETAAAGLKTMFIFLWEAADTENFACCLICLLSGH